VIDEAVKVPRAQPEALTSDFARRASSARAIAAVFLVMTLMATVSTLAMSGQLSLALPQLLAGVGFGWAYWVSRTPSRASFAGSITVAAMLAQYVASSRGARNGEEVIAIAYFVALCPLVAKATMRMRGVIVCGAAGAATLVLLAMLRNQVVPGHWRELVGPSYYFAATWVVAVFAAIGAERALRSHIREELRAAHALTDAREAESRYRLVSEQVSDLVSVLDAQGRFVYVSPSHERVLGLPINEVLGRAAPELVHPDDYQTIAQAFLKALQEGSTFTVARLKAKDGNFRWFHIRFSRTDPQSGVPGTVATSARDITEQQRLTEALEGTRRMESLGRLAGGVAHDFNNLLLVIQACADLASRQLPPEHAARADLTDILRTTDRAAALTKQLLTFARRQVLGVRQRSPVSSVVEELAPILERLCGKSIAIKLELARGRNEVNASSVELEQILMNLAANARDAMPDGGSLDIRTRLLRLADAFGQRRRHDRGGAGAHLRAVLHDQAGRSRHGPRSGDRVRSGDAARRARGRDLSSRRGHGVSRVLALRGARDRFQRDACGEAVARRAIRAGRGRRRLGTHVDWANLGRGGPPRDPSRVGGDGHRGGQDFVVALRSHSHGRGAGGGRRPGYPRYAARGASGRSRGRDVWLQSDAGARRRAGTAGCGVLAQAFRRGSADGRARARTRRVLVIDSGGCRRAHARRSPLLGCFGWVSLARAAHRPSQSLRRRSPHRLP
jgi:PAS domain S-box-containing protein